MKINKWTLIFFVLRGFFPLYGDLLLLKTSQEALSLQEKSLDYDSAVERINHQSLTLHSAEYDIQVKEGGIRQARLYPNPAFNYSLETSELGWQYRQEIYSLSQLIELGGKREKKIKMATNDYYAAQYGYEASKLERLWHMGKAFINAVATQELLKLAIDRNKNTAEFKSAAAEKKAAGKISLIEMDKAETANALAKINLKKALSSFKLAKRNLASTWSASEPDFDIVSYPFFEISPPISLEDYLNKLTEQPQIARSMYKYFSAYHNVKLEKAARIPDVTLTLGYSYDQGSNDLVAGVIIPLPLWNRNQGNIKQAKFEMLKTEIERKHLMLLLEAKLYKAYEELLRAYEEIQDLKNILLKTSHQSFDLILEGYREGKIEYLEVLEVKRTLFDLEERYIQALATFHQKRLEIDYLNTENE